MSAMLVVASVGLLAWYLMYPERSDPKSIGYVLWKAGIYRMNIDMATGTMTADPARDVLVVGKTRRELLERFEYLTAPADASAYLQTCLASSPWKDRDAAFLRKTSWLVVFDHDKAIDLILFKGC
jgi:hypothetical protein